MAKVYDLWFDKHGQPTARNGHGNRYLVRWMAHGERGSKTFPDKRKGEADAYAVTIEHQKLAGEYVKPQHGRLTVGAFYESWMAGRVDLKPRSRESVESLWRSQVRERWAARSLASIQHEDVQAWIADMQRRKLSPSRTRQAYHVLTGLLDEAVLARKIGRNPARNVKLPKLPKQEPVSLTHAEVERLAKACGDYRTLVLAFAYCGMRWSEATTTTVGQLDLKRRRINLRAEQTKSGKARSVPLPGFLLEELREHVKGRSKGDLIWTSPRGARLSNQNFRRDVWDDAVVAAGLGDVTPHDLRHTAASLSIQAGANVKAVSRMLGHAEASTTLDIYADLFDDDLERVARSLDGARGAAVAKSGPIGSGNSVPTDEDHEGGEEAV